MTGRPDIPPELRDDWERLLAELEPLGSALLAFSGGADSSLLLAAALRALPGRVRAVICTGPFTPPWETQRARALAADLGVDLLEVDPGEMGDPRITANDPQRCYWCKRRRLMLMTHMAQEMGLDTVIEGSQADDAREDRPGAQAVKELGALSPLARAGLGKEQVRGLSRALGLISADAPAGACLATRAPAGSLLTMDVLERIGRAEAGVRGVLPGQVRVRDHYPLARLELGPEGLALAMASPHRERVAAAVKAAGYRWVCLDMEGYRCGGANS